MVPMVVANCLPRTTARQWDLMRPHLRMGTDSAFKSRPRPGQKPSQTGTQTQLGFVALQFEISVLPRTPVQDGLGGRQRGRFEVRYRSPSR